MPFIRSYTATPRIILNDSNCSSTDKLILGIINSLSYNKEYCYASNSYFAKELSLGTKTISNSLSRLKKQKYIIIKYVDGKRRIYLNPEIVSKANANVVEKNSKSLWKKITTIIEKLIIEKIIEIILVQL